MIPPDAVLSFSYIRGLLSIVRFYWFGSDSFPGLFKEEIERKEAFLEEAGL